MNEQIKQLISELKAAENKDPPLFQTCMRDTGELMMDLAVPVMINCRHWGATRPGITVDSTDL